ncbi:MAG: aspartyl protease family protein [Holophagaceae bacterium]
MRLAVMGFGMAALAVWADSPAPAIPLEPNLFGLPVVKVQLQQRDGTSREVCMAVDTGSEMTAFDRSLGPEFWALDRNLAGKKVEVIAAGGRVVSAEPIRIHHFQCGPVKFRDFQAVRLDLSALNQAMDVPVAGLIGMNLLRDQAFLLDFRNRVLSWGGSAEALHLQDLNYKAGKSIPLVRLSLAGQPLDAVCDTGLTGFLTISEATAKTLQKQTDAAPPSITVTVAGTQSPQPVASTTATVALGTKQWCSPKVEIEEENLLGLSAMWPVVWFDFRRAQVGFVVGPDGYLEVKPAVRQALHAGWDRTGVSPRLVVLGVKPGSIYERAGIRAGDVLKSFGHLEGTALSLATLREAVLGASACSVILERKGRTMRIDLAGSL